MLSRGLPSAGSSSLPQPPAWSPTAKRCRQRVDCPVTLASSSVATPLRVRVIVALPASAWLRLRSAAKRTSPPCWRESCATEIEALPGDSCVVASSRMRTFCGSESNAVMRVSQRGSSGCQLLACRSEAIQISAVPAWFSISQSSAVCSMAGRSAAVSVGCVSGSSSSEGALAISRAFRVALSSSTRWLACSNSPAASASILSAYSRRDSSAPATLDSMLAERSTSSRMVSGAAASAQPIQPPTSGRARKINSASTARMRINMMSRLRSLAWLVELRVAARRNCIAAHCLGRCRMRLIR